MFPIIITSCAVSIQYIYRYDTLITAITITTVKKQ